MMHRNGLGKTSPRWEAGDEGIHGLATGVRWCNSSEGILQLQHLSIPPIPLLFPPLPFNLYHSLQMSFLDDKPHIFLLCLLKQPIYLNQLSSSPIT